MALISSISLPPKSSAFHTAPRRTHMLVPTVRIGSPASFDGRSNHRRAIGMLRNGSSAPHQHTTALPLDLNNRFGQL
eukprot:14297601-Alexandrium_andersonii.AAC.1